MKERSSGCAELRRAGRVGGLSLFILGKLRSRRAVCWACDVDERDIRAGGVDKLFSLVIVRDIIHGGATALSEL